MMVVQSIAGKGEFVSMQSFRGDSAWQKGGTSVGNLQLQML